MMEYQSVEEWEAKGEELYGENFENWKFRCPKCDMVSSGADFKEVGADLNDAYNTCIGRHVEDKGCDWAAFGLFKTMGKGAIVITPFRRKVEVFSFADLQQGGKKDD